MSSLKNNQVKELTIDSLCQCMTQVLSSVPDDLNANLFETGAVDSLKLMLLLSEIERTFCVSFEIQDYKMENFSTVGQLFETIKHIRERATK